MKNYENEHLGFAQFPLISWRAIFVGLIFSVICYVALTALRAAVWTVFRVLLSLMFGSYFASRISKLNDK